MKKANIWNIISFFVWLALIISEVMAIIQILQLNMLPDKYLLLLVVTFVLLALLLGLMMYQQQGKYQKKQLHIRQIIAYILSLLIIIGCGVICHAADKVNKTIDKITTTPEISAIVDVYVMNEDPAREITDLKDYAFAVTEVYDRENTQQAIADIEALLGSKISTVTYPSVFAMIDALYAGEINAMFLNSAYVDILEDLEAYADFTAKVRVIYECEIEEKNPVVVPGPSEGTTDTTSQGTTPVDNDAPLAPFIVYLGGSDTRSKLLVNSRNDVNILAVVNPQTKQILLVNTPRDYYIPNPAGKGANDKLTHCGIYGVDNSIKALENLYDIDISYYARINFTGFETLIDAVGGVTVYSEESFHALTGNYYFKKGENYLNGKEALAFARERYALSGGDNARGKNQMKIIAAVIQKMSSASTLISNYASILNSMQGMFVTDVPQERISDLVKMQLSDMPEWNVLSYAVSGTGGENTTYSMPSVPLYVMYPNEAAVNHGAQLIDRVLAGEILTSEDLAVK